MVLSVPAVEYSSGEGETPIFCLPILRVPVTIRRVRLSRSEEQPHTSVITSNVSRRDRRRVIHVVRPVCTARPHSSTATSPSDLEFAVISLISVFVCGDCASPHKFSGSRWCSPASGLALELDPGPLVLLRSTELPLTTTGLYMCQIIREWGGGTQSYLQAGESRVRLRSFLSSLPGCLPLSQVCLLSSQLPRRRQPRGPASVSLRARSHSQASLRELSTPRLCRLRGPRRPP